MIRSLDIHELDKAAEFGQAFYNERKIPGQFKPEYFVQTWTTVYRSQMGVILVDDVDGVIAAGIGIFLMPDIYDQRLIAQECFLYVRPEYRIGRIMFTLTRAFETWAVEHHAKTFRLSHFLNGPYETLAKFYKRSGYEPLEIHYEKVKL
jgi:GNAT superfamily N-acetyltransferase